jgi:hypothetical protein
MDVLGKLLSHELIPISNSIFEEKEGVPRLRSGTKLVLLDLFKNYLNVDQWPTVIVDNQICNQVGVVVDFMKYFWSQKINEIETLKCFSQRIFQKLLDISPADT